MKLRLKGVEQTSSPGPGIQSQCWEDFLTPVKVVLSSTVLSEAIYVLDLKAKTKIHDDKLQDFHPVFFLTEVLKP